MDVTEHSNLGEKGGRGLVLYDGGCVLCSGWFRFVAARDVERRFMFTAIQSDYGRALALKLNIDPANPDTNAVLLDGQVHLRSDSALAVLAALPGWQWTRVLSGVPKAWLDWFYRIIALNRYRILGRRDVCDLGGGKYKDRVVQ